jgi:hypothetical protein
MESIFKYGKPLIVFLALLVLLGCTEEQRLKLEWKIKSITGKETWLATIYPDKNNLTISKDIGWFQTLPECRIASQRELLLMGTPYPQNGDYECGLNCDSLSDLPAIWICAETLH